MDFHFVNHISNECNRKEVVDIDKKFRLLAVAFLTTDLSERGQLL